MEAAVDWTLPDGFTARERSFCCREDLVITRHSGIFLAVTACLGPIHSLSPASAGIASGMPSTSVLSFLSSHCYFLHPSAFLSRRGSFSTQLFASNLFQKWSDETSIWCGLSLLKYFGDFVAGRCLPLWNRPLVRAPLPFYHLSPPSLYYLSVHAVSVTGCSCPLPCASLFSFVSVLSSFVLGTAVHLQEVFLRPTHQF